MTFLYIKNYLILYIYKTQTDSRLWTGIRVLRLFFSHVLVLFAGYSKELDNPSLDDSDLKIIPLHCTKED